MPRYGKLLEVVLGALGREIGAPGREPEVDRPAAPSAVNVGTTKPQRRPGHRPKRNRGHVVEDPATVGPSGHVEPEQPQVVRARRRGDRGVQPQHVRLDAGPVVVREGRGGVITPPGSP